ncbi:ty3-gypsy retrotransposon protein [Cucumis melo var. makuwa]|uniref:Ty3-gypsy retrotransposon protein n=1 Tax=Cucumis melo var. makuwa TaxID=1194695 RepID=A0A5A7UI05_CUCMM|nr:ty3-gypsy retrotransposon protein [Cucumis melo var. makuwa]TYK27580.1 ty3-gypsy retrotransposon protein [Cucumis melo var. makuwa]
MITSSIRAQYGGPSQTSFMYSKPYTKRINNLRMLIGYQPPKFQQFDRKDNPKQHITHFVETCKNWIKRRPTCQATRLKHERKCFQVVYRFGVGSHPFSDSDVADTLKQLIEKQLIQLL